MMDERPREERSLGELLGDLGREIGTLVREELNLAKAEMSRKASRAGKDVGMVAAGGLLAYVGLLALVAGIIIALGSFLPYWVSAMLVGLALAGGGAFLAKKGLDALKEIDPTPHQTLETLERLQEEVHGSNRPRNRAARPS